MFIGIKTGLIMHTCVMNKLIIAIVKWNISSTFKKWIIISTDGNISDVLYAMEHYGVLWMSFCFYLFHPASSTEPACGFLSKSHQIAAYRATLPRRPANILITQITTKDNSCGQIFFYINQVQIQTERQSRILNVMNKIQLSPA